MGSRHGSGPEVKWGIEKGFDMAAPGPPDYGLVGALTPFVEQKNVSFKLTQINVDRLRDANIPLEDYIRRAADIFGADRLVWGSDIGQSPGTYAEMAACAHEAASRLTESEKKLFLHDNAAAIYGG